MPRSARRGKRDGHRLGAHYPCSGDPGGAPQALCADKGAAQSAASSKTRIIDCNRRQFTVMVPDMPWTVVGVGLAPCMVQKYLKVPALGKTAVNWNGAFCTPGRPGLEGIGVGLPLAGLTLWFVAPGAQMNCTD